MDDRLSETLGQRIVELARIATAMHLDEALHASGYFRQETETGEVGDERQKGKTEEWWVGKRR